MVSAYRVSGDTDRVHLNNLKSGHQVGTNWKYNRLSGKGVIHVGKRIRFILRYDSEKNQQEEYQQRLEAGISL